MDADEEHDQHQEEEEEEAGDPPAVEILADPADEIISPAARVHDLIQATEWQHLVQYLVELMPTSPDGSHPSLLHPFPFLTVWRRQIMDLINAEAYMDAAEIDDKNIRPLGTVATAYAFSDKLHAEKQKIESAVGSKISLNHAHCGSILMEKLILDYLTFYLPDCVGYVLPKRKHSAMWEFVVRVDEPVGGVYKSHADIRCLVCSEEEYTNCNIGVKMEDHLQVCPGITPEASRRYNEALRKKSRKRKRPTTNDDTSSLPTSKTLKVTTVADPLHMIYQKVEEAKGILDGMARIQQDADVKLGVDAMKIILGDISELAASAQRQVPAAAEPQAPQAPVPLVDANALRQALAHVQLQHQPPPPVDANALHQALVNAQVVQQALQAPHPVQAPDLVQLQAVQVPLPAAQAPVNAQVVQHQALQAPQAPHPVQAPELVQLQAAQAPLPAAQAPGLVPPQAAHQPAAAAAAAAAPLQEDGEEDYYHVFGDADFLPDLPPV